MFCPFCNHDDTRVVDSRLLGDGDQVRRRRECQKCQIRFTTYETAELNFPKLVKRDGTRESFDEEKLRRGVHRALEKRPVTVDKVEGAINHIKAYIRAGGEREIASSLVGEFVMAELRNLDKVAYVRFASVYRSFEDVKAFLEEIESLENELPEKLRERQLDLLSADTQKKK
jgi:transcriptional repressor NrdR